MTSLDEDNGMLPIVVIHLVAKLFIHAFVHSEIKVDKVQLSENGSLSVCVSDIIITWKDGFKRSTSMHWRESSK